MTVRLLKPTSPGLRDMTVRVFSDVTKNHPQKSLTSPLKKNGGRNNQGRITVRHIGGGHKRLYRNIDFVRNNEVPGHIIAIEYDPNRSPYIALIAHEDGNKSYILCTKDMKVGQKVESGDKVKVSDGNSMMLKNIPTGIPVHNIELCAGKGGTIVRSAGTSATIMAHEGKYSVIKLPSGELRRILSTNHASIGVLSNADHENIVIGKAGRNRWLGIRPTVRGKAMNPNTHPHGGGEGVNSIGMKYPKTPWGSPALGRRTRDKNKNSKLIIKRINSVK